MALVDSPQCIATIATSITFFCPFTPAISDIPAIPATPANSDIPATHPTHPTFTTLVLILVLLILLLPQGFLQEGSPQTSQVWLTSYGSPGFYFCNNYKHIGILLETKPVSQVS